MKRLERRLRALEAKTTPPPAAPVPVVHLWLRQPDGTRTFLWDSSKGLPLTGRPPAPPPNE